MEASLQDPECFIRKRIFVQHTNTASAQDLSLTGNSKDSQRKWLFSGGRGLKIRKNDPIISALDSLRPPHHVLDSGH